MEWIYQDSFHYWLINSFKFREILPFFFTKFVKIITIFVAWCCFWSFLDISTSMTLPWLHFSDSIWSMYHLSCLLFCFSFFIPYIISIFNCYKKNSTFEWFNNKCERILYLIFPLLLGYLWESNREIILHCSCWLQPSLGEYNFEVAF